YDPISVENQANKSAGPKKANNSAGTQANDDQGANLKENDLNEEHCTCEKPVSQVKQVFLEELEKLKRQEKEANNAAKSLRKEATHDIQNANTSSTNQINTASTPLSIASPSRAFNDGELSYPDPFNDQASKQSYLRPFECHVTILNTIDKLGKFDGKSDSGFLVRYSLNSKAFGVYNLETKRVEEKLHVNFLENKPNVAGKGHAWMFDLDYLNNSMTYEPISVENQANKSAGPKKANNSAGTQANDDQGANLEENDLNEEHCVLPLWSAYSTTVKSSEDKIERTMVSRHVRSQKEATHDIQNANTSSTNQINTASTPLSIASPSRAFNDGELSYPDPFKYA
nr:ribonuclease H-like domain-containing protein [Tanacetum cinerariifolium]